MHYGSVVPKVGSFTQCAVCWSTHSGLSLLHICTDMGARW